MMSLASGRTVLALAVLSASWVPAQDSAASSAAAPAPKAWRQLFDGKSLEGWTPKIRGYELGDNFANTFRVVDGLLTVSYDGYDDGFARRFGHLFHAEMFGNYRLRVEYRFIGDQAKDGPGWAFRNSGLMLHGQAPTAMDKDQDFPDSIEVQLLGGKAEGERTTLNLCTPGTHVVMNQKLVKRHCTSSVSKTYRGDGWVTAEVVVRGNTFRHIMEGNTVLAYDDPQLNDGTQLRKGSISLQSESHPVQFRKVEILELDAPGAWFEPLAADSLDTHCETTGNWSLKDGVATLVPREGESGWRRFGAYLWFKGDYADFEAEFEYRVEKKGNSGFYFHVGDTASPVATGIEMQIYDTPWGKKRLTDHDSGGFIPGRAPDVNAAKQAGEWNHVHVLCENGQVWITLNSMLVNQIPLDHPKIKDRPRTGRIGFQDHGMPLEVRNVRIRGV